MMTTTLLAADADLKPPVAAVKPKELTIHGDTRVDPYFWLREKTNPEVISYLEAENKYTEALMKPTEGLQKKLYDEILGRIKQTDQSVPVRRDEFLYYTKTQEGKQYVIHCRRPLAGGEEQVILDENELAKGQKYLRTGSVSPSPDHKMLAYTVDNAGDEDYTIYIKNLASGEILPDRVVKMDGSVVWANDNQTLFYITIDAAHRPHKVWRHALGTQQSDDALVYEEKDERFFVDVARSRSKRFLFISTASKLSSEVRYIDAAQPIGEFKLFAPRRDNVKYSVEDQGDFFYIRTNENAKNYKLLRTPIANPDIAKATEVLAHRADTKIENLDGFKNFLVVYERNNGLMKMRVEDTRSGKIHYIDFPEPAYLAMPGQNATYDTKVLRFIYTSLITPMSTYDYDMDSRSRELMKREEVLGGYDPKNYVSERIFATASDGTKIPMAVVYKKGFEKNGKAPFLLYGYGSYGSNSDPVFQSARLSLLDRGFGYAIANIRGGAELGETWHDQGKMMTKKNSFTDFIAAAEKLIADKYTSKDKLGIMGGSAGGLLMGAVVNLRPDLFKAVIAKVPFVDVVSSILDPSLPLTVTEYEEWGNPNEKQHYEYMKSYSPYDNVTKKAYPHMLITAGLNDPRVSYWEPAKWTAKLRTMKTDSNLLLLKTNMGAGHFGASGRYERIKETAFDFAFLLKVLGVENPTVTEAKPAAAKTGGEE
jgi:oligopeptidase B